MVAAADPAAHPHAGLYDPHLSRVPGGALTPILVAPKLAY